MTSDELIQRFKSYPYENRGFSGGLRCMGAQNAEGVKYNKQS
jgi:hypothetical protein